MAKKPVEKRRLPQREAYTLSSLDQIKILADPLRVRILEAFCEERTTKQVAQLLGEKPTKLYHHVVALLRVGLIEPTRTQQNRGTVEKYYLAVARTFRADSRVFNADRNAQGQKATALHQVVSTFFETTVAELGALAEHADDDTSTIEKEAIVSFLEIHASKKKIGEIRRTLQKLIESVSKDAGDAAADTERYRLTLAYFPLDVTTDTPTKRR